MDEIINSMAPEARELMAGICYELAIHNDILKAMSEEQKDVMCAVFGKIIYENIELPEDDNE